MVLIHAHPIIVSPQPLLCQPLLPLLELTPLLRALDFAPVVLLLCFELLDARAAVDVVEAKFEDTVIVDAAFADVLGVAARAGEIFAVVQPEFFSLCGAVEAWCENAAEGSAFDVGIWVCVRSPEFDGVVDAHFRSVMLEASEVAMK